MPMKVGNVSFPAWGRPILKSKVLIYDIDKFIDEMSTRTQRTIEALNSPCKICGSTINVEMHHINPIKNIKQKDFLNTQKSKLNRRQIPVCQSCHNKIHKGEYNGPKL